MQYGKNAEQSEKQDEKRDADGTNKNNKSEKVIAKLKAAPQGAQIVPMPKTEKSLLPACLKSS